jgi:hypothetical protein
VSARSAATLTAQRAFERLPLTAREGMKRARATFSGLTQLKRNQAMLAQRVARLEGSSGARPVVARPEDPRFPQGVRSRVCTEAQLREPWFEEWCAALAEPARANRKLWEHAYLAHVLAALGHLQPGQRGVGFGVGREPLVALFAGRGCRVVATDLPPDARDARGWSNTAQYAGGLEGLAYPALCDPIRFRESVTWQAVDMRSIPTGLRNFDFCWSACSLEHLGSLAAGLDFIEASLATVRPGGLAVHTTEYNVGSNEATLEEGSTVLYRRRDLEALAARLEGQGHQVAALDLDAGHGALDEYVDLPPYVDAPHLRLLYRQFVTTSVALVTRRGVDT